jgi:hypothetical protein
MCKGTRPESNGSNSIQPAVFMAMMRARGKLQKCNDKGKDVFRKDMPPPT